MFTVGLDLTAETRSGLIDGVLKLVLSHPMQLLGRDGRRGDGARHGGGRPEPARQMLLPFDIYTPENV